MVMFVEAVTAEEAETLMGVTVEVQDLSDQLYSAMSGEFLDVYYDAYYDGMSYGTP